MNIDMHENSASKLRNAIQANAIFSGISGGAILLLNHQLAPWLGLGEMSLWPVGLVLVLFSAQLFWMSRSKTVQAGMIRSVIFSDWAWVAGTAVLLLVWGESFSLKGIFLMLDIAVVVAVFAIWQSRGLARVMETHHTVRR